MHRDPAHAFDRHAAHYDDERRRLIPCFDAFYGAAVEALRLLGRPPRRVLDVGAGTGMLARHIAAAHPEAELTLLDAAPAMLDEARAALGEDGARYVTADMTHPLPPGPWDAIVSALAIHHLDPEAQTTVYTRAHEALALGGVFVNAEYTAGAGPAFDDLFAAWHERRARELGAGDHEWSGARERMAYDQLATIEEHLRRLRAAGFGEADVVFRDHRFAVLTGRKAA